MSSEDDAEKEVARVAMNYSASADGYAEFWSPVIRPLGRRLLEALPWDRASRILDVGTGTGAHIHDILSFAPAARVVGIDRSFGMLARARGPRVPLVTMDAMALGIRAATFDIAVLVFVLFHVPDRIAALAGVKRALRRQGTVGVTTWAEEAATPAGQIWDEELSGCGAWDPSPQPSNHEALNTPEKVGGLLSAAGFTPGRLWMERVEYQWDVPRFTGLRTSFGATRRKLGTLDPRERAAVLDRIKERMSHLGSKDLLCRGTAICATAAA
jgi:SAM-dependent methyltransferase